MAGFLFVVPTIMGCQKTGERPLHPTILERKEATKLAMLCLYTEKQESTFRLTCIDVDNAVQTLSLLYTLSVGTRIPELMKQLGRLASSTMKGQTTLFKANLKMKIYLYLPCELLGKNLTTLPTHPRTEDESVAMDLIKFYKATFKGNNTDEDSIEYCGSGLPSYFVAVTGHKKTSPTGSVI